VNYTADVLQQRTLTAPATIALGTSIINTTVTGSGATTTTGADNVRTRVTLTQNSIATVQGITGTGTGSTLFNAGNISGSRTLSGAFATPGNKSGTVQFAVATAENGGAGLTGEGTYASVGYDFSGTAIEKSLPSFQAGTQALSLTINFTPVIEGDNTLQTQSFSVFNRGGSSAFTADLDLTSGGDVTSAGGLSINLANADIDQLLRGSGLARVASFNASGLPAGNYSRTYTLSFSDAAVFSGNGQTVLGAGLSGELTLNLIATVNVIPEPMTAGIILCLAGRMFLRRRATV
jgi:hypothetical protein